MREGRSLLVAGTTIAGWREDCLSGDHSFDTNVFHYYGDWLKGFGLDGASRGCAGAPLVDTNRDVSGATDTLSDVKTEVTYPLDVASGTAWLAVAMNAEEDGTGSNDFDLYLIKGAEADIGKAVCAEDGPGQFGFCELKDPAPGPWRIVVKRKQGQGAFQVAVTQVAR